MAAYGLYTHIAANKTRSMLLLGGLFLLVYVIVYACALIIEVLNNGGAPVDFYLRAGLFDVIRTLPYSTSAAIAWIVIAYFFHQSIIDAVTGGTDVTRQEQPRLYNLLENLCISRGIPMPKLKLVQSPALNAFATGLNQRQYAVSVTTGLLDALNDQEIEAVLGHELTHIRNGDVQMMVIAVIIAGVVGFFAELLFRGFFNFGRYGRSWGGGYGGGGSSWSSSSSSSRSSSSGGSDRKSSGGGAAILVILIAIVLIVLAWALSQLVRLALSRSREYLADAGSVELTKDPDAMISALRKIEGRGELHGATSAVMELCLDNPREGFSDLFATHPSVESRVQALVKYTGGHYEGPLALPMHPDAQEEAPAGSQLPPPLPPGSGPWDNASGPAGQSQGTPDGPWGNQIGTPAGPSTDASTGASGGPSTGPATGPWGRH
jgi:heat shock protein HtpX